ncbi:MAG: L,D-transpeptidase family protein [Bacillota bacterium]
MSGCNNIPEAGTNITIFRSSRRLQYSQGDHAVKVYPVAVGKFSTPTPTGNYKVINKIVNPGGMLGTRWMGLDIPGGNYGIHGTNNPSSIGKFISNGCIRMHNRDVEEIFPMVAVGTPVQITDHDDIPAVDSGYPPQQGQGKKYVVKAGDTLWNISARFGVPLDALISANNLADPDFLIPGQVIIIP